MLNKVIIQGRLVAEPELRHTAQGTAVANVRMAVDRDFKRPDGSRETDFFQVIAWRGGAEFLAKYFHKGQLACVEGRLQARDYTDNTGVRRFVTEIVAENLYFCGGKKSESNAAPYGEPTGFTEAEDDGQLPF